MPAKNILMVTTPWWNCLSRGKGSKTMTSAQNWPKTAAVFFKTLNWVRWIIDYLAKEKDLLNIYSTPSSFTMYWQSWHCFHKH